MKRSKITNLGILNLLGVFVTFFMIGVITTFLYSPVIKTNASESDNTEIGAEISTVASVTLDTNNLEFTFTPNSSGTFLSKTVTATAKTNSQNGHEMYFSSVDNNTDMVHNTVTDGSSVAISNVISSDFTGTVTSATMGNNKWGYSLDNTSALDDKLFSPIPTKSNQLTLKNIDHLPETTEEKTATVNIGIKVDNTLASGTYTKDLLFSVTAHEVVINKNRLVELTSMQDSNLSSYCSASYTPTTSATSSTTSKVFTGDFVPEATLRDERDGNTYTVRKLADGNCWMTENLRLVLNKGLKLNSTNTDILNEWTILDSEVTQTQPIEKPWATPGAGNKWNDYSAITNDEINTVHSYYGESYSDERKSTVTTAFTADGEEQDLGVFYNWFTATAKSGTSSTINDKASYSVCPKGWQIPNRTENKSFNNLLSANYYNVGTNTQEGVNTVMSFPFSIIRGGQYFYHRTDYAVSVDYGDYLWTNYATSNLIANRLLVDKGPQVYSFSTIPKVFGHHIRCVAR